MSETGSISACEERLRQAMISSDVAALEELLSDQLVFTDHQGRRLAKSEDLAAHRSAVLTVESIDRTGDAVIRRLGNVATVCVGVDLAGTYEGRAFFGRFVYSRVWHFEAGRWQVILAHCSAVPASS